MQQQGNKGVANGILVSRSALPSVTHHPPPASPFLFLLFIIKTMLQFTG